MIRFSFVVCTYNRASSLKRTIESLCLQVYPKEQYEIVVVDNNSSDDTQNICLQQRIQYGHVNLRVFIEESQGVSFARNRGVHEASGELIIFIDDDETIQTNYLDRLSGYLKEYPQAKLCATAVIPVYEGNKPEWMSPFTERLIGGAFMQKAQNVKLLGKKDYPGTGHTMVSKSLFAKYGIYDTRLGRCGKNLMGAEDKEMALRWIKNGVECYFFPNIPIYHHISADKLTKQYFHKLTYGIGRSERIRTLSSSKFSFYLKLLNEALKWGASFILYFYYLATLRSSKGNQLLLFRWNVARGLLSSGE